MPKGKHQSSSESTTKAGALPEETQEAHLIDDGLVYAQESFLPLDDVATDPDAWDDTALVAAFDAAIASYPGVLSSDVGRSVSEKKHPSETPDSRSSSEREPVDLQAAVEQDEHTGVSRYSQSRGEAESNILYKCDAKNSSPRPKSREPTERTTYSIEDPRASDHHRYRPPGLQSRPKRHILLPPPPLLHGGGTGDQEELEQLLASYYEAGYRAGRYAATLERQNATTSI